MRRSVPKSPFEPARVVVLGLLVVAVSSGCTEDARSLTVRIQTGLAAGYEARWVQAELYRGSVPCRAPGEALHSGGRVLAPSDQAALSRGTLTATAFEHLAPGVFTVRAILRHPPANGLRGDDEGEVLTSRCLTVSLSADRVVRIPFTVDCLSVMCPAPMGDPSFDQCLNGRCVDPRCDPDEPSTTEWCCDRSLLGALCDTAPTLCAASADCTTSARCTEPPSCEDGACIEPEGDTCGEGAYCARAIDACLPTVALPEPDAGAPDTGGLDGGPLDAFRPAPLDAPSFDAPIVDAFSPDAVLVAPAPLTLTASLLGTIDTIGVALAGGAPLFAMRHESGYSIMGASGFGGTPGALLYTTSTGPIFFELSGALSRDDGPFVTTSGDAWVLTGSMLGSVQGPGCTGTLTSMLRDGYVVAYARGAGGCRWAITTGGAGNESLGPPVAWSSGGTQHVIVPVRTDARAFGSPHAAGALVAFDVGAGSTGTPRLTWELPFQPTSAAIDGDLLVVVGDDGHVRAIDLGAPTTSPPLWEDTWTHPAAVVTQLEAVTVDATGIVAVGTVTSGATSALLAGGDDGWVVAADRDGTRRFGLVFGGVAADRALHVATGGGRLLVDGVVDGTTFVGFRSGRADERDVVFLEVDRASGNVTAYARIADSWPAGIVLRSDGTGIGATRRVSLGF